MPDNDRVRRAQRAYIKNKRQAEQQAADEKARLAAEEVARKEAFVRQNLPTYRAATEAALRRLEAQGFPDLQEISYEQRWDFLGISGTRKIKKLGWMVWAISLGDNVSSGFDDVYLLVDGTFLLQSYWQHTIDYPGSTNTREISVEDIVRMDYHHADTPILPGLAALGTVAGSTSSNQ